MPIPNLIEIVPVRARLRAAIVLPGSKSITNRALILAALRDGETVLKGALWSEDTEVLVDSLRELGFMVNVAQDPDEPCNRTIALYGKGGTVPRGGTMDSPLELFVGNAGTAARFLLALACLGAGVYRLHGVERMHQRPQRALLEALRQLGYRIDAENDRLPALVHGAGPRPGRCRVSLQESSQFASALLLCAERAGWQVEVFGENADESPYVRMTAELVKRFREPHSTMDIEPDASSGSYFVGAGWLLRQPESAQPSEVLVERWPNSGWQADQAFPAVVAHNPAFSRGPSVLDQGADQQESEIVAGRVHRATLGIRPQSSISRLHDLADSIMTAIVLAPFGAAPVRFADLGRLRVQECERVFALRTELTKCGAKVIEEGDTLTVYPSVVQGAEIETYNDHRIAMCFAMLGLKVPAMRLRNASCVKKTFPNFFQKLAGAPPRGLGALVLDCRTGQPLPEEDLFAV